jgi:hypothetical protein
VPKSYQLVIYIFQTAYQELALIGQKVTEKMSAKASHQEILAEFVEGAKQSPAQWYSLKPLQNGIPSLADLMEVSSENLHIIFKNAGLGKLGQRNKMFSFQPSNFESFRSEHIATYSIRSMDTFRVYGRKDST